MHVIGATTIVEPETIWLAHGKRRPEEGFLSTSGNQIPGSYHLRPCSTFPIDFYMPYF